DQKWRSGFGQKRFTFFDQNKLRFPGKQMNDLNGNDYIFHGKKFKIIIEIMSSIYCCVDCNTEM
ncbi:MAG: hypothetical protein WAU24_11585, partial [Chitinophagaceae bacterium]